MSNLAGCMAYLNKLPSANSGSGGHNATLQAALACRRFGLTRAEMWEAMQWFNDNRCTPRWKEHELRHKIESVSDLAVKKPLGQARPFKRATRVFVAPERPEHKPDSRPICQRPAQDEELWWARVALERGTTLQDLDNQGPTNEANQS